MGSHSRRRLERYKRKRARALKYLRGQKIRPVKKGYGREKPYPSLLADFTASAHPAALIIGEYHTDKTSKKALVDYMPIYKAAGAVIVHELLLKEHQKYLDDYILHGKKLASALKAHLRELDREWGLQGEYSYTGIVKAARRHGVRIIAGDDRDTYEAELLGADCPLPGTQLDKDEKQPDRLNNWHDRMLLYNASAAKLIARELARKHPVIALMGCDHALRSEHSNPESGIPGLAELFGTRAILLIDKRAHEPGKEWTRGTLPHRRERLKQASHFNL